MCEGASKETLDLKILSRRDRAPPLPRFEIPGSATDGNKLPQSMVVGSVRLVGKPENRFLKFINLMQVRIHV